MHLLITLSCRDWHVSTEAWSAIPGWWVKCSWRQI